MKRDRALPELEIEIELQPIVPVTGDGGNARIAPQPVAPRDKRRRRLALAGVAIATAIVIVGLSVAGNEPDPQAVTPSPAPAPSSTPVAAPTTVRTRTPNILGATATSMLLWSFDSQFRLQTLDLDSGDLRPLGVRGGFALFPLHRNVVIFDGDNGSSVVSAIGATSAENLGPAVYPVVVRDARKLWVVSDPAPRRWQLRAVDGTILDELPFDANFSLVSYSDRAVLLVSIDGTSLFDLVTRQRQPLTTTRVIAASGPNLIGRTCTDDGCTLTLIDFETRRERVLIGDLSVQDAYNAALSPDGLHLAITRKAVESGRYAEIVDVDTGATRWRSPAGVSFSGSEPAWSWSPDSRWLFVAMSPERVLVADVRNPSNQIDIALSLTPLNGIAVTYR